MKFTVFGATGFIGRNLERYLQTHGHEIFAPTRNDLSITNQQLGHVIYCIGLTADFRSRPFDTVHAHISILSNILEHANFESFLYLSSTRVYTKSSRTDENTTLIVSPEDASDLYNLTKLTGESLCLNCGRPNTKIARLSNVVGFDKTSTNFLPSLIKEALNGHITLNSHIDSEKDYVDLAVTIDLLPRIALQGRHRIYNLASGINTSHKDIVQQLINRTGCEVSIIENAPTYHYHRINIDRLRGEFTFESIPFNHMLSNLITDWHHYSSRGTVK